MSALSSRCACSDGNAACHTIAPLSRRLGPSSAILRCTLRSRSYLCLHNIQTRAEHAYDVRPAPNRAADVGKGKVLGSEPSAIRSVQCEAAERKRLRLHSPQCTILLCATFRICRSMLLSIMSSGHAVTAVFPWTMQGTQIPPTHVVPTVAPARYLPVLQAAIPYNSRSRQAQHASPNGLA